ncbi:protein-tyrosine phosphatase domain-containing protein [Ditylenchus destructor]|uniref:Protein-tyrosine phosphatase domain-containing protein n=1 Tax=Ditylenchus destructor TaxID=166010 RepID=A0AAD4MKN7_9BILA|nr:protein-tyrosine phosphatase domain-containing protein [Ditylenchus destructor]
MLTNLKDNGYYIEDGMPTAGLVEKCAQYWPEKPNTPMLIDFPSQIQVTMSKPTTKNYGYVRTFTVTHTVQKDKTHKLIQYHFTQWPDLGVPGDYNMFLEFMKDVQKAIWAINVFMFPTVKVFVIPRFCKFQGGVICDWIGLGEELTNRKAYFGTESLISEIRHFLPKIRDLKRKYFAPLGFGVIQPLSLSEGD